jgi:hypothetical protein
VRNAGRAADVRARGNDPELDVPEAGGPQDPAAARVARDKRQSGGASLVLESVSPRWRGVLSGLLHQGYSLGYLLAALAFLTVYPAMAATHPTYAWRVMFFLGGLFVLCTCAGAEERTESNVVVNAESDEGEHDQFTEMGEYGQPAWAERKTRGSFRPPSPTCGGRC